MLTPSDPIIGHCEFVGHRDPYCGRLEWRGCCHARRGAADRPVKGQLLLADCLVSPVRTPMHFGEALLAPQPGGRLMLGVTVEEVGFDVRVTVAGVRAILDRTAALVPGLDELPLYRAWAGLRPATPDDWPYMGPVLPIRNLWVSTGHYRKGILLAPLCARWLAASIRADRLDDQLLPFKPTRRRASKSE